MAGAKLGLAVAVVALVGLSAGAALAGPPFRTDDPEPVEYQHWEIYGFVQSTHVRGDTAGTMPGLEVNYGALPNLQLHAAAPIAFDQREDNGTHRGYGDMELGVKYRFIDEDEDGWRPQVGTFPMFEIPTGNASRNLGAGHSRQFIPLWVQKSFGAWTTYGGGGYWINHGAGNRNYWYTGWLLQRQVTEALALGGELFHQTPDTDGGSSTTGFNFGGIYDFTVNHHLLFSAGRGLQHAATTDEFSYYAAYLLTF
jgi:hypothetical protein